MNQSSNQNTPQNKLILKQDQQNGHSNSKFLVSMVHQFLHKNVQPNQESINTNQMELSNCSLQNSKHFFKAQISLLMKMIDEMTKMYTKEKNQNYELSKKLLQYKNQIVKYQLRQQEATQNKETIKRFKSSFSRIQRSFNVKSTNKRQQISQQDIFGEAQQAFDQIQPFNKKQKSQENRKQRKQRKNYIYEINQSQKKVYKQSPQECLCQKGKIQLQYFDLKAELKKISQLNKSLIEEKENNLINQEILKTKFQNLSKKCIELENTQGTLNFQYKLRIQRYKQIIRNIRIQNSPKKNTQFKRIGHYSINKPINLEDQQVQNILNSSVQSIEIQKNKQIKTNYREQNQYLRNQLIKQLDKTGQLKLRLRNLEKQINQLKIKQNQKLNDDQNNINKNNIPQNIFKKNKKASILFVQNTEKKQLEIMEAQKNQKIFKKLYQLLQIETQIKEISFSQKLQIIYKKVVQKNQLIKLKQVQIKELKQRNNKLFEELSKIDYKKKFDIQQLKTFLREITQNPSNLSQDSTDKAFKSIQIYKTQTQIQNKTQMLKKEIVKNQNTIQDLKSQLEEKDQLILEYRKIISTYKNILLKNDKQSQKKKYNSYNIQQKIQERNIQTYNKIQLENAQFQMFKQKLTEFYQKTIHQLNVWKSQILTKPIQSSKNDPYKITSSIKIISQNIVRQFSQSSSSNRNISPFIDSGDEDFQNEMFKLKKLSKSFVAEQSYNDIIKRRMLQFQQYSSNLINQIIPISNKKQQENNQAIGEKDENQFYKVKGQRYYHQSEIKHVELQKKQIKYNIQMENFDARSQSVSSSQLITIEKLKNINLEIRRNQKQLEKDNQGLGIFQRGEMFKKNF